MGPTWGRQDPGGPHVGHVSLAIWVLTCNLRAHITDYVLQHFFCEIALSWMPESTFKDRSVLVPVMVWCRQMTSNYPNQYRPRSISSYGVTRPQLCPMRRMWSYAFQLFIISLFTVIFGEHVTHRGHWWRRLQPTSSIITDAKSVDSNLYDFAMQGWRRLNRGADVIIGLSRRHPWVKRVNISLSTRHQHVSFLYRSESVKNYIYAKIQAEICMFTSKIVEVWIDRFCVRYDVWRRLQLTSSVSSMWC